MTFTARQVLTAAQLNDLSIDTLTTTGNVTVGGTLTATIGAAGSDGQVQYNNGGSFAGASSLYYDDVNSRVGIGTTSPSQTLDVRSANDNTSVFQHTTNGSDARIELRAPEAGGTSRAGQVFFDPDANFVGFRNGNINAMGVDSSGNVGIGTTTPTYTLDVDAGADGNILRLKGANDTLNITVGAGDYSILNSQQSNGLVIYDGGSGVEIWYNGAAVLEADSGGVKVSGSRVLTTSDEGSGNGLDADTVDGSHASAFATAVHTHSYLPTAGGTVTGNVTVNGYLVTNEIRDRTGQQLVLGAGESQGKHTGMTGEFVYLTAEGGIQIRTPDSGHGNYNSGWVERSITIGQGKMTFPDAVETKIQLYNQYYIGIEGSTMAFTSNRYFRFYEDGDSGVKVQIDTNTNGVITCYGDTTTADYIQIYADTSWSRIHANQQIYMNRWIHPDPGVRAYDLGSAASPVLSFRSDTDVGIYRHTTNQLGLTAGNSVGCIVASGTIVTASLATSTTSGYQYVLRNNTFGTLYRFTSTIELKEQVATFDGSGDLIDSLRPVTFIPKFIPNQPTPDDEDDEFDPTSETDAQRQMREADLQYGFIAEEVATAGDGKLAQYEWTEDGQLKATGWKWPDLIAVLTAEVKSLRQRVASLESAA